MTPQKHDVIIIGSGPAGLTAAIYAARARYAPLVIAGTTYGGQLMNTTDIENFPGFPEGINGAQLMQQMIDQAERFGAQMVYKEATRVDFSEPENLAVWVGEEEYRAKTVILATGSRPRKLGLPSEDTYWGRGVSSCATCDGAFYRDKVVAVIGGGDSAMEEATFLTRFAKKVYVVHRRAELRASKIMAERAMKNEKIEFLWNREVLEVVGEQTVTGLRLKDNQEGREETVPLDGMFLGIGHLPNTDFLFAEEGKEPAVQLDPLGFILTTDHTATSVDGVFVAGDVYDHHYQQAITAAGMGCKAAMDAEKWLEARAG